MQNLEFVIAVVFWGEICLIFRANEHENNNVIVEGRFVCGRVLLCPRRWFWKKIRSWKFEISGFRLCEDHFCINKTRIATNNEQNMLNRKKCLEILFAHRVCDFCCIFHVEMMYQHKHPENSGGVVVRGPVPRICWGKGFVMFCFIVVGGNGLGVHLFH